MNFLKKIKNKVFHSKKSVAEVKDSKPYTLDIGSLLIKSTIATQLCLQNQYRTSSIVHAHKKINFQDTGFSLFSQHEEDGLLLFIFSLIGVTNKKCVEICAGNGIECNTANLIINHKWIGLLVDGQEDNILTAKNFYNSFPTTNIWPPKIVKEWITVNNVNSIISDNGFSGEIDLLSLDIDGIDYWLWKGIEIISPRVVVLEINHLWGPGKSVTVPYKENFQAEFTEYGSDYAGASISAFIKLAKEKGYRLVGGNSIATNVFFIRNDITHDWLTEILPQTLFTHPRADFGMTVRFEKIKNKEWINI